jgi:hypothetical protein
VEQHLALAERGRFLSGGALKLPRELTAALTADDIESGRAFHEGWLRRNGWRPGRRALRLLGSPRFARFLDWVTPTRPTWNGGNSSTWKEALLQVNGFDLDMGYGGEDRALGGRLENLGLRGKQIRYRVPLLHLHHDRPYRSSQVMDENRQIRDRIRRRGETRARMGIQEMLAGDQESREKGTTA